MNDTCLTANPLQFPRFRSLGVESRFGVRQTAANEAAL
jgi:hypothetical protein